MSVSVKIVVKTVDKVVEIDREFPHFRNAGGEIVVGISAIEALEKTAADARAAFE